jgi:hypothetical protein
MGPKRHGNSEHKKYQPAQLQQLYYTGGPIHTPLWDQGNGDFIYIYIDTHTHTHTHTLVKVSRLYEAVDLEQKLK